MDDDDMCANCVTPWKCNGPHETEDDRAEVSTPNVLTNVLTLCDDSYMNTNTATQTTFGLTRVGADSDGHNGYLRGISHSNGTYTALTGAQSKSYRSERGAVAYLARCGFDSYGKRVD